MDTQDYARTFLLRQSLGCKVPIRRLTDKAVAVSLELPFTSAPQEYELPLNERELRLLVAIDGDIPWGGLPLNCDQIHEQQLPPMRLNERNRRKRNEWEEPASLRIEDGHTIVMRRFLLLATGRAIVRRYHPPSFRPQYTLLEVRKNEGKNGGLSVTWRNTGT